MIDSHLHGIEQVPEGYGDFSELSRIVSCVAKPDEWDRQMQIDDPRMIKCYGVHPWYGEEWTVDSKSRLYNILKDDPDAHVGEIGLDSKRGGKILFQTMVMIQQLDLAEYFGRVVSIHDVGCEKMVLDSLKGRKLKAILHSYGSDSYVKPYSELECYFSISPRLLSRSDIRVQRLMEAIPEDRLLLETDSPVCGKDFKGMRDFADRLSSIIGKPADDLIATAEENLRRLFP